MKYGLDIENKAISLKVNNILLESGHAVVDCKQSLQTMFGEAFFRKALLANQTRVDIYFNVKDQKEEDDSIEVYVSKTERITNFIDSFKARMNNYGFNKINFKDGSGLYLCQKIMVPCIIINIKTNLIDITKDEFSKELTECLMNM